MYGRSLAINRLDRHYDEDGISSGNEGTWISNFAQYIYREITTHTETVLDQIKVIILKSLSGCNGRGELNFTSNISNIGFITVHGLNEGHIAPLNFTSVILIKRHVMSWTNQILLHYSDVIRARWRLKSPTSRLFVQPFVQAKKISKLRVTGLCEGNPPVTDGFPS